MTDATVPVVRKTRRGKGTVAGARRKPGRQLRRDWQAVYLVALRETGQPYLAAETADLSPRTVQREREVNPAFNELCEIARETKIDALEQKLEDLADKTGNPLGLFGRLKAMRPATWVERNQQLIVTVDLTPPPEQVSSILASLLARLTPATHAVLASHALPLPPDPPSSP